MNYRYFKMGYLSIFIMLYAILSNKTITIIRDVCRSRNNFQANIGIYESSYFICIVNN